MPRDRRADDEDNDLPHRRDPSGLPYSGLGAVALVSVAGVFALTVVGVVALWFASRPIAEVAVPAPARPDPASKSAPQSVAEPDTPAPVPTPPQVLTPPPAPPTGATKPREPAKMEPRARFTPGTPNAYPVYLTADGSRALARVWYKTANRYQVEVWELTPEPKKLREFPGDLSAVAPDGKRVICRDTRTGTDVIDSETGRTVSTLRPGDGRDSYFAGPDLVAAVKWLPRIGSPDEVYPTRVEAYDARTGTRTGGFDLPNHAGLPYIRPIPGGSNILVGWPVAPRVEVWDARAGLRVSAVDLPNPLKITPWRGYQPSPDGRHVTTYAADRSFRSVVSDVATGAEIATVPGVWLETVLFVPGRPGLVLAMSHDWQAYGMNGSGWVAYDLARKEVTAVFPGARHFAQRSADGRVMATKAEYETPEVLVYDLTRLP